MRISPLLATVMTGAASIAALSTPAQAAGAAEPLYDLTAIASPCTDGTISAHDIDVTQTGPGRLAGFYNLAANSSCGDRIYYVEGSGTSWSVTETPWVGNVIAVASDTTGAYLLHRARDYSSRLTVSKRTVAGAYENLAQLGERPELGGGIVAHNGQWAAVWSAQPDPDHAAELYQAGPLLGLANTASRISHDNVADREPTIARDATTGGLSIAWSRGDDGRLHIARHRSGNRWPPRQLSGRLATDIDLVLSGGKTFLTWTDGTDPRAMFADDVSGSFAATQRPVGRGINGGWHGRLTVSGDRVYNTYGTVSSDNVLIARHPLNDRESYYPRALPSTANNESMHAAAGIAVDGTTATILAIKGGRLFAARLSADA